MTHEAAGGRRAENKRATREAILAAAQRLFAEHGYAQSTVRDIARAANVTERTFYRYFDGKESLLAEEYLTLIGELRDAIVARPLQEPPLAAVRRAVIEVARRARAGADPAPLWLFSARPFAGLRKSAPRPLLRLEASVADALLTRLRAVPAPAGAGQDDEYRAQVLARVAVAAFRSAVTRHRELAERGEGASPGVQELVDQAFAAIGAR